MNETAIPWCDVTWNPIVGCENGCSYCYAKRAVPHVARQVAARTGKPICQDCMDFRPHLHEARLDLPYRVKRSALVFADSMSDWWSRGVAPFWRLQATTRMGQASWHRYVVLTKKPGSITDASYWPECAWLGVSITSGVDWSRWNILADLPKRIHKFVSIEPLLEEHVAHEIAFSWKGRPEWVIIGPLSTHKHLGMGMFRMEREQEAIRAMCAHHHIPVFEKAGLPLQPPIRQMPPDLAAVFRKGGLTP